MVAREATAERLQIHGIEVQSERLGSFSARPQATAVLEQPVPLLLVATKATTLDSALERIQAPPRLTVPLLNGFEHMRVLQQRFGPQRVAAGVIRVESHSPHPGRIIQTSPFLRVDMAADDPRVRPALDRVAEMLEHAGIPTRLEDSEAQVLWSKLVRLVALACTTSASDRTIGFIRSDPQWRAVLTASIEEAAAVAGAEGAHVDPTATFAELDDAHPGLGSSMQRDISAAREPELDAIAGAVLRAGKRHGVGCPTIARLSLEIAERGGPHPLRV